MKKNVLYVTQAAIIAALYVVLTCVAGAVNLANGAIQLRFSEALTILPLFTPAAIPGLFIGCIISNLLTGCVIIDVVFGSLATLVGAIGTAWLKKLPYLAPICPVIANGLIVPYVLKYAYGIKDAYLYLVITVGIGEVLSCFVLGLMLYKVLDKNRRIFIID